ncbi:ESPR-type extended signal peptide-containing protein [Dialister invisus]|nr:ESPR-type extended signal peptide-containing protein [Dialister invisus]
MNHIYKVIWSRVKNSYVVVSEIAGTARKSGRVRVSKNTLAAVLAAFLLTGISVSPVSAALDGVNTFVEPGNQNIKIGNDIDLRNNNTKNGAIAIGDHAQIDDYVMQEGSIAIGKNAFVENMYGMQENNFKFGQSNEKKWASSVAIGQNSYARSGSVMIGDHKYIGKLGDVEVDGSDVQKVKSRNVNINATTVGANSYNQGAFSTISGTYSIISGKYDGSNWSSHVGQNFGATVMGSLNSIESATSSSMYSGVANSIVGTANRTHNANGTLVFGAGNEVTNSVDNIANPMSFLGLNNPKELAEKLREDIRRNDSGGAVLAIGGGNKADYAYRSQLVGVGNTLEGTAAEKAAYNLLNGYRNTGTNVSGVTVIGTNRTISNAKDTIVMGSSAGGITTTASKAVILGSEANAEKDGGVALGADSVASVDKDIAGYDPSTKLASTNTSAAWKATHAAVSVGNGSTATRQITGVAAGTNDTDAVNVAQLKAIAGGTGSIHFVSVKGGNASSVNYNNDGAKETGAIAIGANAEATANSAVAMGFNAQSNGSGSIVIGESSGLIPDASKRGASKGNSSIIIGTENVDKGGTKDHAGSNDGIIGSNNTIQESNGAFVTGAFNHVSDSYQFGQLSASEQQELAQAMADGKPLGKYIGKWGSHVFVTGDGNTVSQGMNVTISGSQNTVENSKSQTVIGDSNKITDRNAGTVSGKQEERTKNVSDLVIGKGNDISGNDTYMKGYESLTVIGNNNKAVNPSSSIVIGDNQKLSAIKESVVIGSMTPEEKADPDIGQKHASVVVGYHAQSGTRDGGGMNVALGHGAKAYGWQETVTGIKSIVEAGSGYDGYLASVYGGLNTVASNKADQNDGMANTVVGTLNKTEGANGALVFGAGNSVTHSFGTAPTDEDGNSMNEHWSDAILGGGQKYAMGEGPLGHDELRKAMGLAMSTGGGSVVTMGNGNTSDYAVHSQIIGSGNILTGTANTPSINNTINGYGNTGRNVERMSMMGTGNNMSGSTADVVIGDYHHMDGGKNNVILGSMATEKKIVEKTYTMKDASGNVILEKKYKVMENVPIKSHTANISNAVMLGYNTDVEKDGGVAIGADSVASVDKGAAGYDPSTDTASADTSATWKATAAAVSVGKAATPTSAAVTRQITNVAAGTQDTDAVNVAQLKKVQAAAGAAKVHYYSAKSTKTGAGSNYDNDGAEAEDSIVLGISSSSKGVNSTVLGNNNKLTGVKNGRNNSIIAGQNLEVEGAHNAVFGTDYNNYDHKLTKVFGEQNTVIGLGNLVGYTAEKDPSDPTKWIYTKNSSGSDQNVAVGMTNTVNGGSMAFGKNSLVDDLGTSVGYGNEIVGSDDGGGQRGLALGNRLTVKGEEAVAVGTNASATADWAITMGTKSSAEKETAMAFGYDSHAKVAGGVALGSWSVVDTAAGVSGYDPSTKAASTDTSAAWKSTVGAVSVGDASKGITRQITGVAAGAADTDAVNVAQLKKVEATAAAAKTNVTAGDNVTVTHDSTTNTYKVSAKDTYTTGGTYDAATKKIKFTQNDPSKNYEVDVSGLVGSGGTGSLTFAGDTGSAITKNSGETLQITGGATEVAAANNIGVVSENGKLNLKLAKNIDLGSDGSIKTGDTKMDNKGLAIQGGPSVTKGGIDAGSKKITHVAAGEISATSTDAVNGSQLQAVKNDVQNNTQNIYNMGKKVGELGTRINKVGAGAAALAALHPLDFDPHDKWDIAAGFGNYRNASAAAVGLFYRPNERTMMSLGWTMGDDRNMLNAGISVKLGRGDVYTRYSKVEMANQIKDLKEKNDKMQAENKEMRSELDELKAQVAALAAKK